MTLMKVLSFSQGMEMRWRGEAVFVPLQYCSGFCRFSQCVWAVLRKSPSEHAEEFLCWRRPEPFLFSAPLRSTLSSCLPCIPFLPLKNLELMLLAIESIHFKKSGLLRYNLHVVKIFPLRCTVLYLLTNLQIYNHHSIWDTGYLSQDSLHPTGINLHLPTFW